MTIRDLPVHSARCSACGVLYADEETSNYLFNYATTLAWLMNADGWQVFPPLCPPCQPAGDEP